MLEAAGDFLGRGFAHFGLGLVDGADLIGEGFLGQGPLAHL